SVQRTLANAGTVRPRKGNEFDRHAVSLYHDFARSFRDCTRPSSRSMTPKTFHALLVSVILSLVFPLFTSAQTADEIVRKALVARGGVDKIKALQGQRITGTISFGPGADGSFLIELQRPLKMHTEISVQSQTIVRVYDGRSAGWVINP